MSLINCPECGKEISDKAEVCPQCGLPIPEEQKYADIYLKRESKAYFCAVKYEAYLDDQLWGVLKNGDELHNNLPCGFHRIKLIDKTNFNKVVYDNNFVLGEEGLTLSFSASMTPKVKSVFNLEKQGSINRITYDQGSYIADTPMQSYYSGGNNCPKCGGVMNYQTVSEPRKTGCGTIILFIILALTILGLLIVIPILLRQKNNTVTYAVCQNCGYKKRV